MTAQQKRGVTRGYVRGLIAASLVVAVALLVAVWGFTSLLGSVPPVHTESVPRWAAPVLIIVALGVLAALLWQQSLALLRGKTSPSWSSILVGALLAYLIWCLGGTLFGMVIDETWTSLFAWLLVPIWGLVGLMYWALLVRRVYTEMPTPQWPWEKGDSSQ
ncbi:hypothetical protein [Leucobacter sp. 1207-22]|uniref:hypothetical protein n=1 Tax=Leucobacter sp. 1207-22 TaxID=2604456 RepID=UPI0040632225